MIRIRLCVFETNSSSANTLVMFTKEEWQRFKSGAKIQASDGKPEFISDERYEELLCILEERLLSNFDSEDYKRERREEFRGNPMQDNACVWTYEGLKAMPVKAIIPTTTSTGKELIIVSLETQE